MEDGVYSSFIKVKDRYLPSPSPGVKQRSCSSLCREGGDAHHLLPHQRHGQRRRRRVGPPADPRRPHVQRRGASLPHRPRLDPGGRSGDEGGGANGRPGRGPGRHGVHLPGQQPRQSGDGHVRGQRLLPR
jgi:hypothetical protein